jgi:hypothetical protein
MLSEHLRLLTIGISAGLLISIALTRFLQAWLFGISATDPFLFCSALLILSALSVLRLSYRRDVLPFSTRRKPCVANNCVHPATPVDYRRKNLEVQNLNLTPHAMIH